MYSEKKPKYIIDTFGGLAGRLESRLTITSYAEYIGAKVINDKNEVPEGAEIIYENGYDIYCNSALCNQITNVLKTRKFVKKALENAGKIIVGKNEDGSDKTYLDLMLLQRIEGKNNAGSSYKVDSKEELYEMLISQNWEETTHSDVKEGCRVFKCNLEGLEGILNLDNLPDDIELYAIDPKQTGRIGMGAGNVEKKLASQTYLIVGKENINGKEEDIVFTFHPGEPVRPSEIETKDILDGTRLTKEQAKKLGFDKVKYLSEEMLEQYRHKNKSMSLKNAVYESKKLDKKIISLQKEKNKENRG